MRQKEINNKLGQGISALIGNNKNNPNRNTDMINNDIATEIELDKIVAGKYQPRLNFDYDELERLALSIKENKLIQPIIVRKLKDSDLYEIIAGERRYRAAKLAKLTKISAIIKKINDKQALEIAIVENIQRKDLSVIEEAKGYKRMADEFGYNQEEISSKVSKSRSHIANLLRLLQLPENVQNMVNDNLLTMGHARALINSSNPEVMANIILQDSLNVREVEDMIRGDKEIKYNKKKVKNNEYNNISKIIEEKYNVKTIIKYNNKKNGQIIIKFDEIEKMQKIINKLI